MCSFIFTTKEVKNLEEINRVTKFRGPDETSFVSLNGFNYIHNLLSITGDLTIQPFQKNDVVCLYNGEIYNFKDFGNYNSDGECLIDLYLQYGPKFTKQLDGEFAITLVDYNKQIIIISSDVFKTKPIFYSLENNDIGVSTYSEPLKKLGHNNIKKMKPNNTLVVNFKTWEIIDSFELYEFDIKNQHKLDFNDWVIAFEDSIRKRTINTKEKIYIGLSSGYDSGAICNELIKQKIDFKSYIVKGTENENILNKRIDILISNNKNYDVLYKNDRILENTIRYIKQNTEEFKYTINSSSSDYNEYWLSLTDDGGSRFLSYICHKANKDGYKILMSGVGPDEIFSDYGFQGKKYCSHSNFGGLFPDDLTKIFPWNSFYGSSLESYIAKEEYVGGSYGMEVRYPFLDKKVVQEFLWLHQNLKNSIYKAPLDYYININNFPYNKNVKQGF